MVHAYSSMPALLSTLAIFHTKVDTTLIYNYIHIHINQIFFFNLVK